MLPGALLAGPRPQKLQPPSPGRRAAHHASEDTGADRSALPDLDYTGLQSPETPHSPSLHLRPDAVGLKFLPGVK